MNYVAGPCFRMIHDVRAVLPGSFLSTMGGGKVRTVVTVVLIKGRNTLTMNMMRSGPRLRQPLCCYHITYLVWSNFE